MYEHIKQIFSKAKGMQNSSLFTYVSFSRWWAGKYFLWKVLNTNRPSFLFSTSNLILLFYVFSPNFWILKVIICIVYLAFGGSVEFFSLSFCILLRSRKSGQVTAVLLCVNTSRASYLQNSDLLSWVMSFETNALFKQNNPSHLFLWVLVLFLCFRHNEAYTWTNPTCCVHNIIVGKLWIEQYGNVEITNHK